MDIQEALRSAEAHLRNGLDMAGRPPANEDTLYQWDNQVVAIEGFIARTETLAAGNPVLVSARNQLRDVKKRIERGVLEFEFKKEGEELPAEPTDDELVAEFKEGAADIAALLDHLEKAKIAKIEHVRELDDARGQLDGLLVDTEPLLGKDADLDQLRARAVEVKTQLDDRIATAVSSWRAKDA